MLAWLGRPRFDDYVRASGGLVSSALDVYEWHARLSCELLHDLGHLEVCIRNAYDRTLEAHLNLPEHWVFQGDRLFRGSAAVVKTQGHAATRLEKSLRLLAQARRNLHAPSDVLARLPFGFWCALTSRTHETAIWRPALHLAYPTGTNRANVAAAITRLHQLRNRCAHHRSLLHLDIAALHTDLLNIAGMLQPEVAAHIRQHSHIDGLWQARPARVGTRSRSAKDSP